MSKFKVGDRVVYVPHGTTIPKTKEQVDPINRGVIISKHSNWDDGWWVKWDDCQEKFFRESYERTYLEYEMFSQNVKENKMQPSRATIEYQSNPELSLDEFVNLPDGTTFTHSGRVFVINKWRRSGVSGFAFSIDGGSILYREDITQRDIDIIKFVEVNVIVKE